MSEVINQGHATQTSAENHPIPKTNQQVVPTYERRRDATSDELLQQSNQRVVLSSTNVFR